MTTGPLALWQARVEALGPFTVNPTWATPDAIARALIAAARRRAA